MRMGVSVTVQVSSRRRDGRTSGAYRKMSPAQQPARVAMNVLDQYIQIGDPEILRKTYEFFTRVAPFKPSLQPTLPGIKAQLDFMAATTVPAASRLTPEQLVDRRFLAQLPG
jgi:hypothetical protein